MRRYGRCLISTRWTRQRSHVGSSGIDCVMAQVRRETGRKAESGRTGARWRATRRRQEGKKTKKPASTVAGWHKRGESKAKALRRNDDRMIVGKRVPRAPFGCSPSGGESPSLTLSLGGESAVSWLSDPLCCRVQKNCNWSSSSSCNLSQHAHVSTDGAFPNCSRRRNLLAEITRATALHRFKFRTGKPAAVRMSRQNKSESFIAGIGMRVTGQDDNAC